MEIGTIVMMILIIVGMWGSFAYTLWLAWKKEKAKSHED